MALSAGMHVGPYEIVVPLGAGGMGEVYQAHDTRLNRVVALKILRTDKVADSDRKRRFVNEAQAASRLNHPHIVTVYDIAEWNGFDFIAMEYVRGSTLERLIDSHVLPLKDAIRYAVEIADALTAARAAGIVHRDLKPANIMIAEDRRAKVLDFGLAKLVEPRVPGEQTANRRGSHHRDRSPYVPRAGGGENGRRAVRHLFIWADLIMKCFRGSGPSKARQTAGQSIAVLPFANLLARAIFRPSRWPMYYLGIGDLDRIFESLESAFDVHDSYLPRWLAADPTSDPVRSDPRYEALFRKLNLVAFESLP